MVAKEYPRGLPLTELRIYQPGVGKHPNAKKAQWVGKIVTVKWRAPIFTAYDYDIMADEFIYKVEYFGWVEEMLAHIPESDLHTLVEKKK